ncbi:META domain-containing protein [Croceicoccus gelatinilyticus]|uniref:META domain-containing protein n=1 Tax=Croceicoccus gelatinilyticus TaxID=2835536 RepID=UPI001BD00767|nr:META domain-containing protein [Croceicoccus gelatinilyticus]MBS7670544.1 META domain-containing protein [Croceicoccus gelatinilyticus]
MSRPKSLKYIAIVAALAAAACDSGEAETAAPSPAPTVIATPTPVPVAPKGGGGLLEDGFAPIAFDLAGTSWLVIAIDGEPLAESYSDPATVHFTQSMLHWQGCNYHEGLYVRSRTSFAVGRAVATQVACPDGTPDPAMAQVLGGRPLIGSNSEGKLQLAVEGRSLTLSQIDKRYDEPAAPPLEAGPFRLTTAESGTHPPVLSFKGGTFAIWLDCHGAITGQAQVGNGRMRTGKVEVTQCETHRPTARRTLETFFKGSPAIARGPNGELMLSDGDMIILGQQCHPDPSGCAHAEVEPTV